MLTQEQQDERKGLITSSIAPAILGLSPYKTPYQVWLELTGRMPDDLAGGSTKAIDRGNRLEDLCLDYAADELGLERREAPFRRHKSGYFGDHTDALYGPAGEATITCIGEGKSAAMTVARSYGEEGTDDIPETTLVQSHFHLEHWPEVDLCVVPVIVGGYQFEFRLYEVQRDDRFSDLMMAQLADWYDRHVKADTPPPVEARDSKVISAMQPSHDPDAWASPTPELIELATRHIELTARLKALTEDHERNGNRLRAALGKHEGMIADGLKVTYRQNKDSIVTDWKGLASVALAKMLPGARERLVAEHTTLRGGNRPLVVKPQ